MKTLLSIFVSISVVLTWFIPASATEQIFLPLVITGKTQEEAPSPPVDFRIERKRLWHISENNGGLYASDPIICGDKHLVQIDVYNADGSKHLSGIVIEVRHENNGQISSELVTTEADGAVKVSIGERATVKVVKDVDGKDVSSASEVVTTITSKIPTQTLLGSGYCTDETSCIHFIANNSCQGYFSWGVVFKQSQH